MNYKFRRQYVLLGYIVDFFCPELNMAIEIDGLVHENLQDSDGFRQRIMEKKAFFSTAFRVIPWKLIVNGCLNN